MLSGFPPHGLRGDFFLFPGAPSACALRAEGGLSVSVNSGVMLKRLYFVATALILRDSRPLLAQYGRGSWEICGSVGAVWPQLALNTSCAASAVFAARGASASRETRSDAALRALASETEKASRKKMREAAFKGLCLKNW